MLSGVLLNSLLFAGAALAEEPAASAAEAAPVTAEAAPATKDGRLPAASVQWVQPFGPQGPEFAYVHGDPKSGPYQAFLRMPTGAVSGWHTHDASYVGVVIQGVHQHLVQGETSAVNLGPGSMWEEKGGLNHDDRCIEGPCVIYLVSEGPQTYSPKQADGSNPPPPPPPAPEETGKKKKKKKK